MKVKISDLYDVGSSKRVFQSEWRDSGVPFYRAREIELTAPVRPMPTGTSLQGLKEINQ